MRVAAIDIGTNSVLLLIAEQRDGALVAIHDLATITRLGRGVDSAGRLDPAAIERTLDCLRDYADKIKAADVTTIDAVGTSALRDAGASSNFVDSAEELLGARPRVISGEDEAELTFAGALSNLDVERPVIVFDVGGGSTEVIRGSDSGIEFRTSLDVGAVRLTERFFGGMDRPHAEALENMSQFLDAQLATLPADCSGTGGVVGVAGTVTTLYAIHTEMREYDSAAVHGATLTHAQIVELRDRLATLTIDERKQLPGLAPQRADVIVAGATIVERVLARLDATQLTVSDRGVRWGVAEQLTQTRNI